MNFKRRIKSITFKAILSTSLACSIHLWVFLKNIKGRTQWQLSGRNKVILCFWFIILSLKAYQIMMLPTSCIYNITIDCDGIPSEELINTLRGLEGLSK